MLDFDDTLHKFQVVPQTPQFGLELGNNRFFTSLTSGVPVAALDEALARGRGLWDSFMVPPALSFHAECVALVPKGANPQAAETRFRSNFEFGFVQGISRSPIRMEYWGAIRDHGRTFVSIPMPNTFEVDTAPAIQPWTHMAASRFKVTNVTKAGSTSLSFKVEADFTDHPMLFLRNYLYGANSQLRYLRWLTFTTDFRTIFSFRDKSDGSFTPISATEWSVRYNHFLSYSGNGSSHSIDNRIGSPNFPRGGNPSIVNNTDRNILAMAQAGTPLLTPQVLDQRLNRRSWQETEEAPNADFHAAFWA
jgi:hypothetical protein